MAYVHGDQTVGGKIDAGLRVNQGAAAATLTGTRSLTLRSKFLQVLSAASAQDVVLPDMTSAAAGWAVRVKNNGAGTLTVKTYHATTPVTLQAVAAGETFEFQCHTAGTAAGTWIVGKFIDTDTEASPRCVATGDATTSWGTAAGGYYTITVTAATHGRGVSPTAQLFRSSGTDYLHEAPDEMKINSSGDVIFRVTEDPDERFAWKLVVV